MEELAKDLYKRVSMISEAYYYQKDDAVIKKGGQLAGKIQQYCSVFLQGNVFGMDDDEYQSLQNYVIQVLKDYMGALEKKDLVWMLDTLDYGLRELLKIYIDTETGEDAVG